MNKNKKIKNVILSLFMICVFFLSDSVCLELKANEELKEATGCTFVLNSNFVSTDVKGLFVNRYRPMESSSVSYSVYDNGADAMLTNREKAELAQKGQGMDSMDKLDKHKYESAISEAYANEYGADVGFKVETFENIEIDGYPGYKIISSYEPEGSQVIHQNVYIIRSKNRTFTITYQRAADDECEESFEISAQTIRVH